MRMPVHAVISAIALVVGLAADAPADTRGGAPPDVEFEKVTLNDRPGEPIDLAVLPDGSVLHTTRGGAVWYHHAPTRVNSVAATIDVYEHDEEGLQGIALDPRFGDGVHDWVYLYYSPPLDTPLDDPSTPGVDEGSAPENGSPEDWEPFAGAFRLARFHFRDGQLDLASEQHILDVPADRGICCHVGGDIVFDAAGNLYLSTGDDSNPFASDGYVPIDERLHRHPAFDAQRSAGNTNDLRGKILRLTPGDDGGYSIPAGNLFPAGTPLTRPEIYAMGLRNPFRIEIDRLTDALYVGDYAPDAGSANPQRGPAGQGRWMVDDGPANYGWPYCATPDLPYVDFDFATRRSGAPFDCAHLINNSPRNTGMAELPPVTDVGMHYGYRRSAQFPELGTGGIGPMAGPSYYFDAEVAAQRPRVAWPEYYDAKPLFYDFTRDYLKALGLSGTDVTGIEPVLDSVVANGPIDLEFGSNGALYLLEYGDTYFEENPEARLSRIDYIGPGGNHTPSVSVRGALATAAAPAWAQFRAEVSDADGDGVEYAWDFDGDGVVDSTEPNPRHTYAEPGRYLAHLTITDVGPEEEDRGRSASDFVPIVVRAPVPAPRGSFSDQATRPVAR